MDEKVKLDCQDRLNTRADESFEWKDLLLFFNTAICENSHNCLTVFKILTGWIFYWSELFCSTESFPPGILIHMEYKFMKVLGF